MESNILRGTSLGGYHSACPSKRSVTVVFAISIREILILGLQGCSEAKEWEFTFVESPPCPCTALRTATHSSLTLHHWDWTGRHTQDKQGRAAGQVFQRSRRHEASRWPGAVERSHFWPWSHTGPTSLQCQARQVQWPAHSCLFMCSPLALMEPLHLLAGSWSLPLPPAAVLWAGAGTRLLQTLLSKVPKAVVLLFWEGSYLRIWWKLWPFPRKMHIGTCMEQSAFKFMEVKCRK